MRIGKQSVVSGIILERVHNGVAVAVAVAVATEV
jgi:hypothetical protein